MVLVSIERIHSPDVVGGCGELLVLGAGDTLCYSGQIPHRSRALAGEDPVVYLVTSRPDAG